MTFSTLTTSTSGNAGQYSSRGRKIRGWILHHAATTSRSGVLSMMSTGSRQVSANYVVDGPHIVGVVPEEYRAWTSSSSTGDGENLTVEIVNDRVGATDSTWTISDASYASIAALVADTATRYGFSIDRNNIIGHREVLGRYGQGYATACPSGVDLDRICRDAAAIRQGTTSEPELEKEDPFMSAAVVSTVDGGIYLQTDNGRAGIMHPAHVQTLRSFIEDGQRHMYQEQLDLITYYFAIADTNNDGERAAIQSKIEGLGDIITDNLAQG